MVSIMKNLNKIFAIVGCITAVLNYFEKKKQDAELEEYLEGAIQ